MTLVKICGLTTREHVEAAITAGADFVGFVFASSRRKIGVEKAAELAEFIPPHVKKVGVFVNEAPDTIQDIFNKVPLDFVQYHGTESNAVIKRIGLPSIKAFAIRTDADIEQALQFDVDYYLFDTPGTTFAGGSGQTFDWSLLKNADLNMSKIILAGGLTVDNVAEAIQYIQPNAVDVSSGVELDGIKNAQLIEQFLAAAKGAIV